ncbi:MAG: ATP-dependent DNA helicase RecG [Bacteroidales bacterium]|nr:ATP-dependent DNA helicase RecG [Bacteroidales bacterium]
MERLRHSDIKYLKGVGPARAELLKKELGISSYYDLLYHFPTHYIDRSKIYTISSLEGDVAMVQVKGRFISMATQGEGAKTRLVALFTDGTGLMEVVWFQRVKAIRQAYHIGEEYILFGKPSIFNGRWSMAHPEIDTLESARAREGLRGVYPLTERLRARGITSRQIGAWVQSILPLLPQRLIDPLPPEILSSYRLMGLADALREVHNPQSTATLEKARLRLKFEELFYLQLNILRYTRQRSQQVEGLPFPRIGHFFNTFYQQCLPFPLTEAQKRVIREIRADMGSGRQMNRLLQGDVGSGKTLVALMCMLIALDNGYQACLMAPTEILAHQHYDTLCELLAPIGINVKLLTGSTTAKARRLIHEQLEDGSLHILIGTHAVIEDKVKWARLGLVIIDEQHRFGVAQRAQLWKKNATPPHVLVMTATPIPRTLAMTVYGDLDVSVIDELPPGRRPVKTLLRYEERRMDVYRGVGQQLRQGRQVYIVYPLIKESEKSDLKSLEEGYELIRDTFRDYRVAYVHGKMRQDEKDFQMSLFVKGEAQILVSTTVIEVGVNVPNATIMVIENAERFGLSQLHQLRGRVGRGAAQSYCILMSKVKLARETRQRLEVMTSTTDGFIVAEADLKMRGPGDLEGTLQSGMPIDLKIANLAHDGQVVELARQAASHVLDLDPSLSLPAHQAAAREMHLLFDKTVDWSKIS